MDDFVPGFDHDRAVALLPSLEHALAQASVVVEPINFGLTGSPAVGTVPNSGADYNVATDFSGATRSYPISKGAVGP